MQLKAITNSYSSMYGIAIVVIGLPIIWVIRDLLGYYNNQAFAFGFMLLGIIMTIHRPSLISTVCRLPTLIFSRYSIFLPCSFLLPTLFAAIYYNRPGDLEVIYNLFLLSFIFALQTIPKDKFKKLPLAFFVISTIGCALCIFMIFFYNVDLSSGGRQVVTKNGVSPGPISILGAVNVISSMFFLLYKKNIDDNFCKRFFLYISLLAGLFLVLITAKRTTILGLATIVIFVALDKFKKNKIINERRNIVRDIPLTYQSTNSLTYTNNKVSVKGKRNIFFDFLLISLILLFFGGMLSEYFSDFLESIGTYFQSNWDYLSRGFFTLLGEDDEMSALHRKITIDKAWNELNLLGHGYKSLWVDSPLVQAFYDGGILGGVVFLFNSFLLPIYLAFLAIKIKIIGEMNLSRKYSLFIYFLLLPSLFLSGQPYDFTKWLPIILLYSVFEKK